MSQTAAEKLAGERRKRLLKYFTEAPDPRDRTLAWATLVFAVLVAGLAGAIDALVGARFAAQMVLATALVVTMVGLEGLYRYRTGYAKSHPRPADKEMDSLLATELVRIGNTALEKLAITADDLELTGQGWDPVAQLERDAPLRFPTERRPVVIFGPTEGARMEIGADGRWRYSDYHVMAICPTHYNLGLYVCVIDVLSGALKGEGTREFHYDDVVAISTATVGEQEPSRLVLRNEEFRFARSVRRELQIVVSSGDGPKIPVVLPGHGSPKRVQLLASEIEDVITAVRRVLRDRKGAGRFEGV